MSSRSELTAALEHGGSYPSIARTTPPEDVANIVLHIEYVAALYGTLLGVTAGLLEHSHAANIAQAPDFTFSAAVTTLGAVGIALNEVGHRIKETLVRWKWL